MRFYLNTTDPVIKLLLEYCGGDENLLEAAMHDATDEGFPVKVETIKKHIDKLKEPTYEG